MKKLLVLILVISGTARAAENSDKIGSSAVYFGDQRQEFYEIENPLVQSLAGSTLALFPKENLRRNGSTFELDLSPMSLRLNLCPDEKYASQPAAADCSAVLVGPQRVFTAGHCITARTCENTLFAFGYQNSRPGLTPTSISPGEVYACKKVVARSNLENLDYAVVDLDRPVVGHLPVQISSTRARVGQSVFILGHPGGAPLKHSLPSPLLSSNNNLFTAEIAALGGSSGAGVFLEGTNQLSGILISGEEDYVLDQVHHCLRVKNCDGGECDGEDSIHVEVILKALHGLSENRTAGSHGDRSLFLHNKSRNHRSATADVDQQ